MRLRINPTPLPIFGLLALGIVCLGACAQAPNTSALDAQMAQLQANKETMQRFFAEVVDNGNLDAVNQMVSEDFVEHEEFPGLPAGREGCYQFFAMMKTAFPDMKTQVNLMVAEGDLVSCEITWTGTHQGEFMGIPATGNQVTFRSCEIVRIENGVTTEHWGVTDGLAMMMGMGAIEGPM